MSVDAETRFGNLRRVRNNPGARWLLKCPGCGDWLPLTDKMLAGRVSVDHKSMGCAGRYHETHDFAAAIAATIGEP